MQPAAPVLPPSQVARIGLSPLKLVLDASDSLKLTATAYDAAGQPVADARLRFSGTASNAGRVDTSGWMYARGTGKVTGAVMSLIPGYKPVVRRFEVVMVPDALRGDLRAQGREIGHLNTADMDGFTKNAAFTWGVVVNPKDGLAYVIDFNNGLWVVP